MSGSINLIDIKLEESKLVHDVCGNHIPVEMAGKPSGCIETERGLKYLPGDVVIVTFPKTGTTLVQYMCHLIRTHGKPKEFEDIHQVCPHTSSAWFIGQDLNAEQEALPRLFKSHRQLNQVAPYTTGVKYISTIRDPMTTLSSIYSFVKARKSDADDVGLLDFARSSKWMKGFNPGCVSTVYDHFATFWECRHCSDYLLLPYEDLTQNRALWIPIIAQFMEISLTTEMVTLIAELTSKENMLLHVSKFDESWCKKERERLNRPHPLIKEAAAKVTTGQSHIFTNATLDDQEKLLLLNELLWQEKVVNMTGMKTYETMRQALYTQYFPTTNMN